MQIIKEELEIEETLHKRIKNVLKFLNIKAKVIKGNIISISKTNLAYIEPHKLVINNITYLFFNECENVYINTLEKYIPFNELENYIKTQKSIIILIEIIYQICINRFFSLIYRTNSNLSKGLKKDIWNIVIYEAV